MKLVSFLESPTLQPTLNKPLAMANKAYPYNLISDPKRFEELLYNLFKIQIENSLFGDFDNIVLMSGVRDLGRDCALFKNGEMAGLIQCKKYDRNYNKSDFGNEITKFVLYSILDDRLIPNPDCFTYYIVVSKGFTDECATFIETFHSEIKTTYELKDWIDNNIKNPTLTDLKLENSDVLLKNVINILSKINVKKLIPEDLDRLLNLDICMGLIPSFFEVKTIYLKSNQVKLSREDLLDQLKKSSLSLKSEVSTFDGIINSHIDRDETQQLLNWVLSPNKQVQGGKLSNICLLAGAAGYGKTVILRDLYEKCLEQDIPTLALKADKLYSYTLNDLKDHIGCAQSVFEFIDECKGHFKNIVIIIDQLDALSQSMSADRSYLNVFKNLIENCSNDENIKVVISIRSYDLYYDPSLGIYKDLKKISVKELSEDITLKLLGQLGISKYDISNRLLHLLRIPNNLNVYSQLMSESGTIKEARNLQDLYFLLWDQKIKTASKHTVSNTNLKKVLYSIAGKMFETQRIFVSEYAFEDFAKELTFLESESILKREKHSLQFFHQSFYDFVFSKRFVESGDDIVTYIKDNAQSIHIRSAIKMIISYLRDYSYQTYMQSIETILSDFTIHFHIKHLIFSLIIAIEEPESGEFQLVLNLVKNDEQFCHIFFELANYKSWFTCFKNNNLKEVLNLGATNTESDLYKYKRNIFISFLRRFTSYGNDEDAWTYIGQICDLDIIRYLLYCLNEWEYSICYEYFTKCYEGAITIENQFDFFHTLENIAPVNPEFTVEILKEKLADYYYIETNRDHNEDGLLKKLAKLVPEKLFQILVNIIINDIKLMPDDDFNYYKQAKYKDIEFEDRGYYKGLELAYQMLGICLKELASSNKKEFMLLWETYKNSDYPVIVKPFIFAFKGNESNYAQQIYYHVMFYLKDKTLLKYDSDFEFSLRCLFEQGFSFFSEEEKFELVNTVAHYEDKNEISSYSTSKSKLKFFSNWGLAKYYWMLRIPKEYICTNQGIVKSFQELQRRFTQKMDMPPNKHVLAGIVRSPINGDRYIHMKKEDWMEAFRKYNNNDTWRFRDDHKGGLDELARAFKDFVEQKHDILSLEIINACIDDSTINIKYPIYGIWGWVESKESQLFLVLPSFLKILGQNYKEDYSICLTIANQLITLDNCPFEIVDFLIKTSLDYTYRRADRFDLDTKETSINHGLVGLGINTIYGDAASGVIHINNKNYSSLIFKTVDAILKHGPIEARAALYFRYAHLLNLDKESACKLFEKYLSCENNVHVIAATLWSLQYMIWHSWEKVYLKYEYLIDSGKLGDEDAKILFTILYSGSLHGIKHCYKLLLTLLSLHSQVIYHANYMIFKNYNDFKDQVKINNRVLIFTLKVIEKDAIDGMKFSFLHTENISIEELKPFLELYIKSKHFKISEHFVDYLTAQCSNFPLLATFIFQKAIENSKVDKNNTIGSDIEQSIVRFIIGAYNVFSINKKRNASQLEQLLSSFDSVLKDYRFRKSVDNALEDML